VNHNKLLKSYDGCIGVKTGYTKKSGRSLVSAAERDGLTLIAVTINAPDDWRDHTALLDYGYSLLEKRALAYDGEYSFNLPVIEGETDTVCVSNKGALYKILSKDDTDYDVSVKLDRFAVAPIKKGDKLGEVIFSKNDEEIARLPLLADDFVNKKAKKGFFSFFKKG
jgi:D-alanyl-D-alanine carboxypeptidase/D-alanyl-D-alanine carboxypeptidase (penicillin-binding protein 5/6)